MRALSPKTAFSFVLSLFAKFVAVAKDNAGLGRRSFFVQTPERIRRDDRLPGPWRERAARVELRPPSLWTIFLKRGGEWRRPGIARLWIGRICPVGRAAKR